MAQMAQQPPQASWLRLLKMLPLDHGEQHAGLAQPPPRLRAPRAKLGQCFIVGVQISPLESGSLGLNRPDVWSQLHSHTMAPGVGVQAERELLLLCAALCLAREHEVALTSQDGGEVCASVLELVLFLRVLSFTFRSSLSHTS